MKLNELEIGKLYKLKGKWFARINEFNNLEIVNGNYGYNNKEREERDGAVVDCFLYWGEETWERIIEHPVSKTVSRIKEMCLANGKKMEICFETWADDKNGQDVFEEVV